MRTSSTGYRGRVITHAFITAPIISITHNHSSLLHRYSFFIQRFFHTILPSMLFMAFISTSHFLHHIPLSFSKANSPPFFPYVQTTSIHSSLLNQSHNTSSLLQLLIPHLLHIHCPYILIRHLISIVFSISICSFYIPHCSPIECSWHNNSFVKPLYNHSHQKTRELVLPVIVERKRMDDLASSIKDGRFREQKFRLKKCGLSHPVYLVEEHRGSVAGSLR